LDRDTFAFRDYAFDGCLAQTLCDVRHTVERLYVVLMDQKRFEPLENAMTDDTANLDKIDEALMTYDLSDEAVEAAARVDGGQAMTVGYCATAANAWYCLPF